CRRPSPARGGGGDDAPREPTTCSCALPDLPADVLALVADALALVRLRRAHLAHLGGDLADRLLVDALDDHLGRGRHLERDPLRRLQHDGMGVADVQLEVDAPQRGAIADTLDLEALREAVRDALDHVGDQRACEAVQRAVLAALGRALDGDRRVLVVNLHAHGHLLAQLAERAVDHHAPRRDRHRHAGGNLDGLSTDSTHGSPDEADDLAADALLLGGTARDQAVGGGQDCSPHPAEHARQTVLASVHAAAGLGDALQVGDQRVVGAVLLLVLLRLVALVGTDHPEVLDVALLLEQPRDLPLQARARHLGVLVQRAVRVADPREHVCDRVGLHAPSYQLDLVMPGMTPWWARSRRQIRQRPNFL